MIQYCSKCIASSTRPNLNFDSNGVCSACNNALHKAEIDWEKREQRLREVFDRHRRTVDHEYDCLIPVSGGKDSTYQVHIVKKVYNMNPLCVTFRPLSRTVRGEENLQALRNIGVDHIDFAPNPHGINTITKRAFEEFGDCSLIDHLAIYGLIPNIARRLNIPLVIWGENPYLEYGGDEADSSLTQLSRRFFKEHHIIKGREVEDWVNEDLSLQELQSFKYPTEAELDAFGYEPIFLGCYLPWDAAQNIAISTQYGFLSREAGPIMGLYDHADLDCMNIVIHHYFKWLKFGFNRITDHGCNEIRKGRMTRDEAIELVKQYDGCKPPREYIHAFCQQIDITEEYFWEIAERFRNLDIWQQDSNGEWYIAGWIGGDKVPDRFPHVRLDEAEREKLRLLKGV